MSMVYISMGAAVLSVYWTSR